ncbi:hypothetical protein FDV58_17830 [Bradyrhizobium elkanii]|uniref:Uncharacterized protein n=1 Tax=Bradyrhizobium elkanii TaxID=29448 RepID=A0A4U6RXZ0_BRAEL|nr:hypothetical protein [Bradyrhizobium elkanii]TKV80109.1 hypothetical protein FDV58_17830 [Bradyrhizobium elkanii]
MRPTAKLVRSPVRSGTGTLHGIYYEFDLETGVEVTQLTEPGQTSTHADFAWSDVLTWVLVPRNNAGLCVLGMAPYETLDRHSLMQLVYTADKTQDWRAGSVFAVRTRSGEYAKVQLVSDSYNFRWQTYGEPQYLDVQIVLGSTPLALITRYVAECTYESPYGRVICCSGAVGPEGGVLRGRVSDDGVAFPDHVTITIAVDFTPESQLAGIVKTFVQPVMDTGVALLFEPDQVLQVTSLYFDLRPTPFPADYLAVSWRYHGAGGVIASGSKALSGADFGRDSVTQYDIVFQPDPIRSDNLEIEIVGRLQGRDITRFVRAVTLPEPAMVLQSKWDEATQAYGLVSQLDGQA